MKYMLYVLLMLSWQMTVIASDQKGNKAIICFDDKKVTLAAVMAQYNQALEKNDKTDALTWYNIIHLMIGIDWPKDEDHEEVCGNWRRGVRKPINDLWVQNVGKPLKAEVQFLTKKIENDAYEFDISEILKCDKITSDVNQKAKRLGALQEMMGGPKKMQ